MKKTQPVGIKRRIPRQARAETTIATIMEGAAQVLEKGGLAAFTTNAVAERAGVSVGSLYQYFADKEALLMELARRETAAAFASVAKALRGEIDPTPEGRVRAVIRVIINAFHGRQRARKAVLQALLAQGNGSALIVPIGDFISRMRAEMDASPHPVSRSLTPEQHFVVTRAVLGAIRAGVLEEQSFLKSRAFEDEIVRLALAYLRDVAAMP
jgi:AcrR family transcriptional regulator